MDPRTARHNALKNPVVERKTVEGVLNAKVTPEQALLLYDRITAAIRQGMFTQSFDLVALASTVFPKPRGRQQRRDIGNQICALIERIEDIDVLREEPRLARFFKDRDGRPCVHTDIIAAVAVARLKWDKLHREISIDVDDVVDILKDRQP